jgi:hypothetical protein
VELNLDYAADFFVSLCCKELQVSCRDDDTLKAPEQFCHSPVALFSSLPHSRAETIRLAEVSHEAIHRISCGLFTAAIKIFCPLALIEEVEKNCPLSLRSEAVKFYVHVGSWHGVCHTC